LSAIYFPSRLQPRIFNVSAPAGDCRVITLKLRPKLDEAARAAREDSLKMPIGKNKSSPDSGDQTINTKEPQAFLEHAVSLAALGPLNYRTFNLPP
jgi:hypothetical protein